MNYNNKYLKYKAKYLKLKSMIDNNQNKITMLGGGTNKKTIYLFKAEWCPHCVNFKPTWNKLQEELGDKLNFVTYDSKENAKEISEYKINGFPTIILKVDNKAIEYLGPRDESSLRNFIKQYN
jgi:thiol-disulfide isomerase/thioredoxin